jgi:hypothetical protein
MISNSSITLKEYIEIHKRHEENRTSTNERNEYWKLRATQSDNYAYAETSSYLDRF